MRETRQRYPETYEKILTLIKPHSIDALVRKLKEHLNNSKVDLNIFNKNRDLIHIFILEYVKIICKNFPTPGDASGIQGSCRLTRNVTQNILDSRHPTSSLYADKIEKVSCRLNTLEKSFKYELNLYKIQTHFLEITSKRKFSSIYLQNYQLDEIFSIFPFETCLLDVKTMKVIKGCLLKFARFIIVKEHLQMRIFYHQHHSRDLSCLIKHLDFDKIIAFNDLRLIYNKLGTTCFFYNAKHILDMYFKDDNRRFMDMIVALKIMVMSGHLVGQNRNGLSKHPDRSVFEIFGFEAPRNNGIKFSMSEKAGFPIKVRTSRDCEFFGISPNEGTGTKFTIQPKKKRKCE